jgi:hypothetical protein
MTGLVRELRDPVVTTDGVVYTVRVCGLQRADGLWEAWLEFDPDDGAPVLRTSRETTQPNLTDLVYWASGLTPVYLEGALQRALDNTVTPGPEAIADPTVGRDGE